MHLYAEYMFYNLLHQDFLKHVQEKGHMEEDFFPPAQPN